MLNKKKPYGEVHGNAAHAFEQDGKYFNAQGVEVDESGKVIENVGTKGHVDHGEKKEPEFSEKEEGEKSQGADPRADKVKEIESMTVDAIKLKLDQYGAEYDKKAIKADLVSMLVDEELAD